jgi:hypothetical protein
MALGVVRRRSAGSRIIAVGVPKPTQDSVAVSSRSRGGPGGRTFQTRPSVSAAPTPMKPLHSTSSAEIRPSELGRLSGSRQTDATSTMSAVHAVRPAIEPRCMNTEATPATALVASASWIVAIRTLRRTMSAAYREASDPGV